MHHNLAHSYAPGSASNPSEEAVILRQSAVTLQNQVSTLISENNRLISEKEQLNSKLRASSVQTPDIKKTQVEALLAENVKLNDLIVDLKSRNARLQGGGSNNDDLKIQISNLTIENENLRKQVSNRLSFGTDLNSSENQQYQAKISLLITENSKLNDLVVDLEGRNKTILSENESLRVQLNSRLSFSSDLSPMNQQMQTRIAVFVAENNKLGEIINDKDKEIERLKALLAGKPQTIQYSEESSTIITSLQTKINLLMSDNARLVSQISNLSSDNETLRRQLSSRLSLSQEISSPVSASIQNKIAVFVAENHKLGEIILDKDREIERLRGLLTEQSSHVNSKEEEITKLKSKSSDLWSKVRALEEQCAQIEVLKHQVETCENEVNHLNSIIQAKNEEIEGWAQRYKTLEHSFAERQAAIAKEIENKFSIMANENDRVNGLYSKAKKEIDSLKKQIDALNKEINGLRSTSDNEAAWKKQSNTTINELKLQMAGLTDTLKQRSSECEDWKRKYFEQNKEASKVNELEKRCIELNGQNTNLTEHLQDNIQKLHESQLIVLASQDVEKRCELLVKEHHHLNNLLKQKTEEIKILENSLAQADPSRVIHEYEAHLTILAAENETLNKMLTARNREVDNLQDKMKAQSKTGQMIDVLEQKMMELAEENERLQSDAERGRGVENMAHKLHLLEEGARKVVELEDKIEALASEHEDIGAMLETRNREIEEYRKRLIAYDDCRKRLGDLEVKYELLQAESDRLQIVNTEKGREIEGLRNKLSLADRVAVRVRELETRNEIINSENEDFARNLRDRDEEIQTWRMRYEAAAKRANIHDDNDKKIDSLTRNVSEKDRKIKNLERRIATSPDTNSDLDTESNELEILRRRVAEYENAPRTEYDDEENRKLFEEIDRLNKLYKASISETDIWKTRFLRLEQNESKVGELEGKFNIMASENETLAYSLRDKAAELEVWKQKFNNLVQGGKSNSLEYEGQLTQLEGEMMKLNGVIHDKNREIERLNTLMIRNDQKNLHSQIQRADELMNEVESLNQLLRNKDNEIGDLRNKLTAIQVKLNNYSIHESEVEALNRQIARLQDELKISDMKRSNVGPGEYSLDVKIKGFETMAAENSDLRLKVKNLEEQIRHGSLSSSMIFKLEQQQRDIERLANENQTMKKSNVMKRSDHELVSEITQLRGQIKMVSGENEKMADLLIKRGEEIENWKIKLLNSNKDLEDLAKRHRILENDNARLSLSVKALSDESDFLKSKALLGEQQNYSINDLQNKLYVVAAENDRLLLENESLRTRVHVGDVGSMKLSNAEGEKATLQRENAALRAKVESLEIDKQHMIQVVKSGSPLKASGVEVGVLTSSNSLWDGVNLKGAVGLTMLTAEIERLHEVISEIQNGQDEQIEEIRNECQRIVDASEERVLELELEIDRMRLKHEEGEGEGEPEMGEGDEGNGQYDPVEEEDYPDEEQ